MRAFARAAIAAFAAAAAVTGVAEARPWTDAQNRVTLDIPRGWDENDMERRADDQLTYAAFFTASDDCYVVAFPNAATAANTPFEVLHHTEDMAHFPADFWLSQANNIKAAFPDNSAQFVSQSIDTSGFWPIQRAELRNNAGPVHGAVELRPGMDMAMFCTSTNTNKGPEAFDAFIRSLGTPNDATLQATATQQKADYEAHEAAAAAAQAAREQQQQQQQQQQEQAGHRRNRNQNSDQ